MHGDKYDYSSTIYKGSGKKIEIKCPVHGSFYQTPECHFASGGCKKCGNEKRRNKQLLSLEDFINRSKQKHGNKYDYSKAVYNGYETNVIIICSKHGEFKQKPAVHLNGSGCSECSSDLASFNNEIFIQRSRKVHGDKYDYSLSNYKNSMEKVVILCPIHGRFMQLPSSHMNGNGCRKCADLAATKSKNDFLKKAKCVHGNLYSYDLSNYKNRESKISIFCEKHGKFIQSAKNHINAKNICPKCVIDSYRLSHEDFVERAEKIHEGRYDYSKVEYVSSKTKVEVICKQHGIFYQTPSNHLLGKGCNECAKLSTASKIIKNKSTVFEDRANLVHDNKYDYSLADYKKASKKVKIICPEHGEFLQTPNGHLCGSGCQKCQFKNTSIEQFIENILIKYKIEFAKNDRTVIKPRELDFYLPNHDIAIECNGIYWHSELAGKDKNYHLNKTNFCKVKNIKLIHVFQNEIVFSTNIVNSRIKNLLKLNKYKVFARKCEAREINKDLKNAFLEKYHLQGLDKSSVKLGLFYKNRLVAVMTFSKNRKALGKNHVEGEWELSRYAAIANFSIVGGAGKLLKYFEKNWNPKKITSYADKRWSEGDLYKKLGFSKIRESKPNYWYFKGNGEILYHRFNFRKSELKKKLDKFDPNMTEWENMKENGWNRIWDCGSLVFEKTIE